MLTDREREIKLRLRDDFLYYAPRCLKIRPKEGEVKPLQLNRAQQFFHDKIEEQLARTGRVRAIVLKGRQQGISTYVEGRFYWKVTHRKGVAAFILTHEEKATANLFEMVERYHDHCPKVEKPQTEASNAKELIFGRLDSGYKVGTAGAKGTGRSATIQFFHGSEVAFWPHAKDHAAGVMQAISDSPGTEIILESTANGIGNYFHKLWQKAEAGQSEYIPVFIPWFWQDEYQKAPPPGFQFTDEEEEYQHIYGLTLEQMAWVRGKLDEFGGDWTKFHQEYPATSALAFQYSGHESFIQSKLIMAARKCQIDHPTGPKIGGLDVARHGDDRTALVIRQGRAVPFIETREKTDDLMAVVGFAKKMLVEHQLDRLFIDLTGMGYGVHDRLKEVLREEDQQKGRDGIDRLADRVEGVTVSESPMDSEKYPIKRDEMWGEMKDWLKDAPCSIPDDDALHADLAAVGFTYDSKSRTKLTGKKELKAKGIRSPDLGDALALTFAYPVAPRQETVHNAAGEHHGGNAWMAT